MFIDITLKICWKNEINRWTIRGVYLKFTIKIKIN